jgi:hypothetical protein
MIMNKLKNIVAGLAVGAACLIPCTVKAQPGFDSFEDLRTYVLVVTNMIGGASGAGFTNGWMEHRVLTGPATITIAVITNGGASAPTAQYVNIQVSADTTNITSLTNYMFIPTNTPAIFTNFFWGSNAASPIITNYVLKPGITVTPTASTAGFATPLLTNYGTLTYTNGGSLSLTPSNNVYLVGLGGPLGGKIDDLPLYIRVVSTNANLAGTNIGIVVTLTARPRLN